MAAWARRDPERDENRRIAWVLIGVMIVLVAISVVTIIVKHRGIA